MNKFENSISKDELNKKPIIQFQGNIVLVDNYEDEKKAFNDLNNTSILGFDTETKPSFKKGKKNKVALLQLSTNQNAYLFRMHKHIPLLIFDLLENNSIVKVGAAIRDDLIGLQKYNKFKAANFVELQDYVNHFNITDKGLKKLSAIILGARISKSQQTSNWENKTLTEAQLIYAATDAWVCLEIYNKLNSLNNG